MAANVPLLRAKVTKLPVAGYALIHLACLGIVSTGVTWRGVSICMGSYWFRVFWMGAGFHRYFAHRTFKTSRPMQFVFAVLAMSGLQRGPLWWAQTHRYHHQHADRPDDLHSPRYQGFWYSHWGWFFAEENRRTHLSKIADLARFPELVWLNGAPAISLIAIGYALLLFALFGWDGLLWGFCVSTVCVWHTVHWIQSFSHSRGGYRRFDTGDSSRNHWLLGVVSLGEYHNNHHAFPSSARQGFAWWEIDCIYQALRIMSWFGLVWDVRSLPDAANTGPHA
ncbi:MAG: acyl-CoA desaturase [Bryobacteraceae bacterium]